MDTNKQIEFYHGQIFEGEYSEEAAEFCNNSGKYFIEEIELLKDGTRRFEIKEIHAPDLEDVREQKYVENDTKCHEARFNQTFTTTIDGVKLAFITNAQTQADLQTALILLNNGVKSYPWPDEVGHWRLFFIRCFFHELLRMRYEHELIPHCRLLCHMRQYVDGFVIFVQGF